MTTPSDSQQQQKKKTYRIVDFAGNWVKLKEIEKRPCWRNKKPWNMKVTVKPIVIGALGAIRKRLVKWIRLRN